MHWMLLVLISMGEDATMYDLELGTQSRSSFYHMAGKDHVTTESETLGDKFDLHNYL